jgi:hypothetical protein
LLTQSLAGVDPKRLFAAVNYRIARGSFALDEAVSDKAESPNMHRRIGGSRRW